MRVLSAERIDFDFSQLQLVIPKFHGAKLTDIPDDHLQEILVRDLALRAILVANNTH